MNLPAPMLPDPERSFGPRQARVAAAAGRWARRQNATRRRIDLLNAILGDLIEVLAIERRSGVGGDVDRTHGLPARGIKGIQLVSGCKPDVPTIERDPMHVVDTRKGSIFAEDFCC